VEVFYRRPDSTYVVPPEPETKAGSDDKQEQEEEEEEEEEKEEEEEETSGLQSRASSAGHDTSVQLI